VINPEKPECPVCHKAFRLPEIPPAVITENENKPDNSGNGHKPGIEVTVSTGGKEMRGTLTDFGIRARVNIPQIQELSIGKIGMNKDGKLMASFSFQAVYTADTEEFGFTESALYRIIHMLNQHCKMGVTFTADKVQTDFLDILDPANGKRVLAQVSRADLEAKGFGIRETKEASPEAEKAIEEAKERARVYNEKTSNEEFKKLESANPDNPDNKKQEGKPEPVPAGAAS
jgi:hypothetical protein